MKSRDEKATPQIACPQCRAPAPADSQSCPACGAALYATCPDCGLRRGAEDVFCRKCGFNFSLRKLRLKEEPAPAAAASGNELPRIGWAAPGKRHTYRMSPWKARFRAFFMFAALLTIAAGLFFALNRDWGQAVGKSLREQARRLSSAWPGDAGQPKQDAEPDWKDRYRYWLEYYRDVFSLPPTNAWVEVGLSNGQRDRGLFAQVAAGVVTLLKEGQSCDYPRLALDENTRRIFFQDEFAAASAAARVKAEMAEWRKPLRPGGTVPGSNIVSAPPAVPSPGATSPAPAAAMTFLDIKCPACGGMGYLVEKAEEGSGRAGAPGAGKSDWLAGGVKLQAGLKAKPPATQAAKQSCPVCGGKGLRRFERAPDFPWPSGASRCGTCHGMGAVLAGMGEGPKQGARCRICDGRGYVVNQFDAAKNAPPKYE